MARPGFPQPWCGLLIAPGSPAVRRLGRINELVVLADSGFYPVAIPIQNSQP